jgi:P-type conjugative transfer protein TrbJ
MSPRRKVLVAAALLAAFALNNSARAEMIVLDPSNLAQNVLTASRELEQINHQIEQIAQQARMLTKNPLQLSPELSSAISQAHALFETAQGIAFEAQKVSGDIKQLYPDTWDQFDLKSVLAKSADWQAESKASLERAMEAEATATNAIQQSGGQIDRALGASQGADGQTGAIQAGNQLLGVNATQLAGIQALLVAQGRALETERLERGAQDAQALEIQKRAFPVGSPAATAPARSAF